MGTQLNKATYEKLINENIEALEKHMPEHSLEKKHTIEVLKWSVDEIYGDKYTYRIWCEWDMGFAPAYSSREAAQAVIDGTDWESMGYTLKEVQENGLVAIEEDKIKCGE